ncbi:Uncharacterised protein [Yersinia enterocolitica]|nr:Uncharacterised protein [Yersinia enterocolitica]VEB04165.1 Uncharacterised protein [Yersinia enterocolitica subsp. enterocolitica]CNB53821.1 Uncharacterised protein [Yersinia enterocolitica]CNB74497.1 Uncharacterised protein [Yersinia enterocolitica]CNB80947.1 Uncharacterised protein [Yersinia enterocolitica]
MCLGGFRLVMIVSVELNADNLTLCAESFSDLCAVFKKMNAANNAAAFRKKPVPQSHGRCSQAARSASR